MNDLAPVLRDLRAEHEELRALVESLDHAQWEMPTPAVPWRIRDQVVHVGYFDAVATHAVQDPAGFEAGVDRTTAGIEAVLADHLHVVDDQLPAGVAVWWRDTHAALHAAAAGAAPDDRVPWYGPSMSVMSMLTARLMETWAHGVDIRDAVGIEEVPTARLRHVAHIGFATREHSFRNRGLDAPTEDVRVELAAPSGECWAWGPAGADDRVVGPALDFCLVVTQRCHVSDTDLAVSGTAAASWMAVAQAFAGPPGSGRAPRRRLGS